MIDTKILEMKEEIIESVRESVKIKSVLGKTEKDMPFGKGVHDALHFALNLADKLGFKTVNLNNMVGYAEFGTGKEMVAILGHLDVVPEGDDWIYPPYGSEIHNGKIFGRGVLDDKGCTIGSLYALKAIKDLNLPIHKRIRIIFGTNEESGSKGVKYYVENGGEIPVLGFTPDAEYPIINGEKGIINLWCKKDLKDNCVIKSLSGGKAPNSVPSVAEAIFYENEPIKTIIKNLVSQQTNIEFHEKISKLIAHGKSAHGSIPEHGVNAVILIIKLLENIDLGYDFNEFINFMVLYFAEDTDGSNLGIAMEDEVSGKLTVNLGKFEIEKDTAKFILNIRYPVTKSYDDFMDKFLNKMNEGNIKIENEIHKKSLYVQPDSPLIKKLQKVYKEKLGKEAKLLSIGGGTYAKSMDNIVAFGPIFEGDHDVIHEANESMSIDNLIKNIQIITAAIYELAK